MAHFHGGNINEVQVVMERVFRALEARDKTAVVSSFTSDAELFDPHYPKPHMKGVAEIEKGNEWGLSVMKRFGFRNERVFNSVDGRSAVFEVDTNHELKSGQKLHFPQVFILELRGGMIAKLRAYEPYGPNGIGGVFLRLTRLKQRIFGPR
jgi:ketosteroid isomerase-like protein